MDDDTLQVIIDGKFQKIDRPAVSVTSRGLLYGDGCFETLRSYHGRFLMLDEHLRRLKNGLDYLGISYPADLKINRLLPQLDGLLQQNDLLQNDSVVRLQVWREGGRGYGTEMPSDAHYSITTTPIETSTDEYRLATVDTKRIPASSVPAQYKLSNSINYIIAARQARHKNADDALMETVRGWVSETTIANIFWVKDDITFTPSIECDILPGITRKITKNILSEKLKIPVKEGSFRVTDIQEADAVWICNSVKEILPVSRIDDYRFATDMAILKRLRKAFVAFRNKHLSKEL